MSKSNRWYMEEEHKLLCDHKKTKCFIDAYDQGFDTWEELHHNYQNLVYKTTGLKIDATEAKWDCETYDHHLEITSNNIMRHGENEANA